MHLADLCSVLVMCKSETTRLNIPHYGKEPVEHNNMRLSDYYRCIDKKSITSLNYDTSVVFSSPQSMVLTS